MKTKNYLKAVLIILLFTVITSQAKSQIVYTDIDPDTTIYVPNVPYNVDSSNRYVFDLNNDAINDFHFLARNYYDDSQIPQYGVSLLLGTLANGKISGGCATGGYREDIPFNDTINKNLNWYLYKHILFSVWNIGYSCDLPLGDAYFGLKLIKDTDTLYGWVRCSATNNSITIKDYAYNATPNAIILAGQTTSGINSFTINNLNIYESNNGLIVNIYSITNPQGYIRIFNTNGLLIKSDSITGNNNTISLAGIASGIYLIQIEILNNMVNKIMFLHLN